MSLSFRGRGVLGLGLFLCLSACATSSEVGETGGGGTTGATTGGGGAGGTGGAGGRGGESTSSSSSSSSSSKTGFVASACPDGSFATGIDLQGWRDACDGCTSAPDRWGQVSPTGCTLGLGPQSTCTTPTLGDKDVQLFGLSMGGDVDGNDKLYLALHCEEPTSGTTTTTGTCPAGQLITAVAEDGTLTCQSPAQVVADYFGAHCTVYFGWRDSCSGCTDPPNKWGRVRDGFCTNDNGVDNTCTETILGGKTLETFGLNTDGDVNDDDELYIGFRCD